MNQNKADKLGNQVYDVSQKLTAAAVHTAQQGAGEEGCIQGIVIATVATAAPIHVLAAMINKSRKMDEPVSADETLFAAILVALVNPGTVQINADTMGSICGWDISVVHDAMEMFERATGKKPDSFLLPAMAKAACDMAQEGNQPFTKFREERAAARAQAERGNNPLN